LALHKIFKRRFNFNDIFLILVNLVPLWGVWVKGWNPKEVFLVYCVESVIIGIYNVLMMWLTTLVKKRDVWENGGTSSIVSGYFFILFFIVHYGFFLFVQVGIFLSIAHIGDLQFTDFFTLLFHVRDYLSTETEKLLLLFIVVNGIIVLKDFVLPGYYKTASINKLLFAPYARVFIQQFCVISGGFLLAFSLGKIFILVFVIAKIVFEILINYKRLLGDASKPTVETN
jgi:hypothetical protein